MADALGEKIFKKTMTKTDLNERLHWPSEFLGELPDFNGAHHVDFSGVDKDGNVWNFRCSKRINCPHHKTVVSAGWVPFVRTKRNLKPGDEVIFYRSAHLNAHFEIRFNHKVLLFGHNINEQEE